MCVQMHTAVALEAERYFQELRRRFYTTPKSYLDLIGLYARLLEERRAAQSSDRDRLVNGLERLRDTNALVDLMQTELSELQPVLAEKTQLTQQLLVQVMFYPQPCL
jgi:dynein heavy chain